jgi:hypothetical protein
MRVHRPKHDDIVKGVEESLEKEIGQKIFTMRIINDFNEQDNTLDTLVVFEDRSILNARIVLLTSNDKLVFRIQGNFI